MPKSASKSTKYTPKTKTTNTASKRGTIKKESSSDSIEILTPTPKSKQLPKFLQTQWNTEGTDTVYGLLFCSSQPFVNFAKGPKFLEVAKEVFDGLCPGSAYKVAEGDALYEKVRLYTF